VRVCRTDSLYAGGWGRRYNAAIKTFDSTGFLNDGTRTEKTLGLPKDSHLCFYELDTMTLPADDCRF
jgi:hypothetical protein